jgi:putative endonuclease
MFFTYILHSETLDKFYIGSTGDTLENRLYKHNVNHKGFTGKVNDWKIVYSEVFNDVYQARSRELQIKKWKSKIMIQKLIAG